MSTYSQGQYLTVGKRYVASFATTGITSGLVSSADIDIWSQGVPWISLSSWNNPLGAPYADWTFTLAQPIDAYGLGISLEGVLNTFNPDLVSNGFSFVQMADAGQGKAAAAQNDPNAPCSISNLGACFAGAKSTLLWVVAGLVLVAFLASGGPGLVRSVSGK